MRPGRIDRKIQYKLATQAQAEALFLRFYPEDVLKRELDRRSLSPSPSPSLPSEKQQQDVSDLLHTLASKFSNAIPSHEFSTAELQGYLLTWKISPSQAAAGAAAWVELEMAEKRANVAQEEEKKNKAAEKEADRVRERYGMGVGLGIPVGRHLPRMGGLGYVPSGNGEVPMTVPTGVELPTVAGITPPPPPSPPVVGPTSGGVVSPVGVYPNQTGVIVPTRKPLTNGTDE